MRGLYAIIDPALCGRHTPLSLAEAVLAGGCGAVQLRDKQADDRGYLELARPILRACRAAAVPFVVNDRTGLAIELGADGLHLGQGDMPVAEARRRGPKLMIGLSTHDLPQVVSAASAGVDLIGFGPVFNTRSKVDPEPVVGLEGLRRACRSSTVPVVAIGGITLDTVRDVRAAGAGMAAVISALASAPDPKALAHRLHADLSEP